MEVNITDKIVRYASLRAQVWNDLFVAMNRETSVDHNIRSFWEVDVDLFNSILHHVGGDYVDLKFVNKSNAVDGLTARPKKGVGEIELLILKNRHETHNDRTGRRVISTQNLDFGFLGFFDWDEVGHKFCAFTKVRVLAGDNYDELSGQDCLVSSGELDFFYKARAQKYPNLIDSS